MGDGFTTDPSNATVVNEKINTRQAGDAHFVRKMHDVRVRSSSRPLSGAHRCPPTHPPSFASVASPANASAVRAEPEGEEAPHPRLGEETQEGWKPGRR